MLERERERERERGFREREKNRKREMRRLVWIEDRSAKRERESFVCLLNWFALSVFLFRWFYTMLLGNTIGNHSRWIRIVALFRKTYPRHDRPNTYSKKVGINGCGLS